MFRETLLLRNKIAIITGATMGIGFSMAKGSSEDHDALTIICSGNIDRARLAVSKININCIAEQVDGSYEYPTGVCKKYWLSTGRIDILVNNTGFYFTKESV
jgi:NAD(P)-dependent dehydrogenase (short-subunit alcohol dehydrogenase family)